MGSDGALVVVCAGDCKIDNHKYKETFGVKAKMLKAEEVETYTNHSIGGVCPLHYQKIPRFIWYESMNVLIMYIQHVAVLILRLN